MKRLFILPLLILLLALPVSAQDIPGDECPPDFDGYLTPRLQSGERARSLANVQLNIRPQPTTQRARLGVLPPGTTFTVAEGPRCGDGFVWWQVEESAGWVAEGDPRTESYWLEPRGEPILITGADGVERAYVRLEDGFIEPEGCLRPPDDYSRVQIGWATLNRRTLAMLDQAQRLYREQGGLIDLRQAITQGSYNPGGVTASFGTHDGGGAVDLSVRDYRDWSILHNEIEPLIEALRIAGFAAWLRDTGELYANSPIHIHAIAVGDADLSPAARRQIDGREGYLRGFNGLPTDNDTPPIPDRYGGPVICGWMVADGWDDLSEADEAGE